MGSAWVVNVVLQDLTPLPPCLGHRFRCGSCAILNGRSGEKPPPGPPTLPLRRPVCGGAPVVSFWPPPAASAQQVDVLLVFRLRRKRGDTGPPALGRPLEYRKPRLIAIGRIPPCEIATAREAKGQVLQHNIFLALLHYRTASPFCSRPASTPHRARSGSCRPDRLRAR